MDSSVDAALERLIEFRSEIHANLTRRADALFETIDAVLEASRIRAVVEVSLAPSFRREYSSVYDALSEGGMDLPALRKVMAKYEPPDAVVIAGYAIHAVDTTIEPHPDADTLEDRGMQYSNCLGKSVPGYQYSWVARVMASGRSWVVPKDVERVPTSEGAGSVAARQVQRLTVPGLKIAVVGDGNYGVEPFLKVFPGLKDTAALVRVRSNQTLFKTSPADESSAQSEAGECGEKMRVSDPPAPDTRTILTRKTIKGREYTVILSAWKNRHLAKLPDLNGMLLRVQVLRADGTLLYGEPLYLFWTGEQDIAQGALLDMYLLRFNLEHFFRFGKQELGLVAARSTDPKALLNWVWVVALAYYQLLLARGLAERVPVPWDPKRRRDPGEPATPGQVLRGWQRLRRLLGTPAVPPGRCGKAPGRPQGVRPKARKRFPVVKGRRNKAVRRQ